MGKRSSNARLHIARETVRELAQGELPAVVGGSGLIPCGTGNCATILWTNCNECFAIRGTIITCLAIHKP